MSEPQRKRPTLDSWKTGTTRRYWDEVEAGRFVEARQLLDLACDRQDAEAWFERGLQEDTNAETR